MKNQSQTHYTTYQLKLPVDLGKIIEISDPVYTFCEVMDHIDLNKYLVVEEYTTGRPQHDRKTLLKIVLFAYMENGYSSLREIEKLCKVDIRFTWLCGDLPAPSFMTVDNFIGDELKGTVEEIWSEINAYIFESENVDLEHVYIDGTKITAKFNLVFVMSTLRFLMLNNTLPTWTASNR